MPVAEEAPLLQVEKSPKTCCKKVLPVTVLAVEAGLAAGFHSGCLNHILERIIIASITYTRARARTRNIYLSEKSAFRRFVENAIAQSPLLSPRITGFCIGPSIFGL